MKYGYARDDRDLDIQVRALSESGCNDIVIGSDPYEAVEKLSHGDGLAIWRIDKISATIAGIESVFRAVHKKGASIFLLSEGVNTQGEYREELSQLIKTLKKI